MDKKKSHEMENKIKLYPRRILPVTRQTVTRQSVTSDAANSRFMMCHTVSKMNSLIEDVPSTPISIIY